MPILYLMRGLPGSGKSTKARTLGVPTIISADDHFMLGGVYHFNATRLPLAHAICQQRCAQAMRRRLSVVVDNTNCTAWEMRPYVALAFEHGYSVRFVEANAPWAKDPVECARRNVHGVPLATIQRMLARWDSDVTPEACIIAERPATSIRHLRQ